MTARVTTSDTVRGGLFQRKKAWDYIAVGAAVGLIALILVLIFFNARKPRHDGKPVSYWIEELTGDEADIAHDALLAIGERAIPGLLEAVKSEPSWSPWQFLDKVSGVPGLEHFADKLAQRRSRREQIPDAAAEVLAGMPTYANRFVPALVKIYQDPKGAEEVIERASGVLSDLGPAASSAMPSYLAHLRGTNSARRHLTVSILAAIGPPAKEAVPLLTALLNGDRSSDLLVAEALWAIDRRTNEALKASVQALQVLPLRIHEGLMRQSLELLTRMGPAAREATPVVRDLFRRCDTIRLPAELTLRSIDASALDEIYSEANEAASRRIEKTLAVLNGQNIWASTPERRNFFRALAAIATLGPKAKAAVPKLVEIMTGKPPQGPPEPARYRPYYGNPSYPREDPSAQMLARVAQVLGQIGDASDTVVVALTSQLHTNSTVSQACCEALGRLGPQARAACPTLLQMLDAPDGSLRLAASMALVQIAPDAGPTIGSALRELETVPDPRIQFAARIALWKLEREGTSPMNDLLSGSMTDFYLDKIKLLGWLGPEAKEALPALIGIVTTNGLTPLRVRAADAIRRIDPATYDQLLLPGPLALPESSQD